MSRATADRACGECGWQGTHVPEDVPYVCPNCHADLIARPVPFDYKRFLEIKAEEEAKKNSQPPQPRPSSN